MELLPLIPEIWANKQQNPFLCPGVVLAGLEGCDSFWSFVLGSLGWLETPEGCGQGHVLGVTARGGPGKGQSPWIIHIFTLSEGRFVCSS